MNSSMTLIDQFIYHLAMPNDLKQKAWRTYEEVAQDLLNRFANEFGLKFVEGKQEVQGQLTDWEIDAKGVVEENAEGTEGFLIVECRHRSRKRTQAEVAQLAFTISDTGAAGGIIVSPSGLQKGAAKIAAGKNIIAVRLSKTSTASDFALQFFDKLFLGLTAKVGITANVTPRYLRVCAKCGKKFPASQNTLLCEDCVPRH
jgi:hypothetical protein